ncbi:MAG: c-type cytochrome domain-containing protein [Pirellulaceae bacterium]|nr:c-type cytochrome domain-containing protein [Pirellulaceae bacterium]
MYAVTLRNAACALLAVFSLPVSLIVAEDVDYERQIAPLLKTYCAGCHNDTDKEGDLSLLSLNALRAGTPKGAVVIAAKPEDSQLFKVISGAAEPKMPPKEEPQLKPEQIALIREWIAQGAKGETKPSELMSRLVAPKLTQDPSAGAKISAVSTAGTDRVAIGKFGVVEVRSNSGQMVWAFDQLPGKVNQLRLSPDGKSLVVATGVTGVAGEVLLLDIENGQVQQRLQGHADAAYCASASADGKWIASGSYDKSVIVWERATGKPARTLSGHNGAIYDLDFDATSSLIATASADQTVKLWSISGERLDTLGQPQGEVLSVRFAPNGNHIFAAGVDRQIRKWQVVSRKEPAINPLLVARFAHEDDVLQIAFLGGDRLISTSVDRTVKLWDTDQLRPLGQLATTPDIPGGIFAKAGAIDVFTMSGEVVTVSPETVTERIASATRNALPLKAKPLAAPAPTALSETKPNAIGETEPNDDFAKAPKVDFPATIDGIIDMNASGVADVDLYRFSATAGQAWIFEVNASRSASPLDSRIEILDENGQGVLQTRLQATRESYFTFRGKDSNTSDDFRVHNWEDMELNEFLYSDGEVVKLWLYPRGPDSGFKVYPGTGSRYTYFGTTPTSHALGAPAYIVRELVDEEEALPNGLPVFPIYYENDDDGLRRWGKDSRLSFVAPRTGDYFLKVRDARGFGGANYKYKLDIHTPRPDFEIKVASNKMKMPVGSGREWQITATRLDDLESEIAVELKGLPEGFVATNPLVIEAGQLSAQGAIYATAATQSLLDAVPESEKSADKPSARKFELTLVARSSNQGQLIEHELKDKIEIELITAPELKVKLVDAVDGSRELDELNIRPGQTITARVVIDRAGVKGPVSFGGDDSGRNLPHGAIVDNIGLNGLLLPDDVNDREFFIKAAKWLPPQRRQIHLRSQSKDNPTSKPIWLNVLPATK